MKTIAFFNSMSGVGKTTLLYHIAWMLADHGVNTLAVDLDPQATLTDMFVDADRLEALWTDDDHPDTVYGAIRPMLRGIGDIAQPAVEQISEHLGLIAGDPGLAAFEDTLAAAWPRCFNNDASALRTITAFHRIIQRGAAWGAEIVLIDVGPNLGAINRSVLIASDLLCLPVAPDLFSLQGLKYFGPTLRRWRSNWAELMRSAPSDLPLPEGSMQPIGYIVVQQSAIDIRTGRSYQPWMDWLPEVYHQAILDESMPCQTDVTHDPACLTLLKYNRSLMPMAVAARKPIFFLKIADGALGSAIEAVQSYYQDFEQLACKIATAAEIQASPRTTHDYR